MIKKAGMIIFTALFCLMVFAPTTALAYHWDTFYQEQVLSGKYIGDTATGKFHYASCRAARRISSENQVFFATQEEAIAAGYEPCKSVRRGYIGYWATLLVIKEHIAKQQIKKLFRCFSTSCAIYDNGAQASSGVCVSQQTFA